MNKFLELRNTYKEFIYEKYQIVETQNSYEIVFYFNIPNLTTFEPKLIIEKTNLKNNNIDK